MIHEIGKTQQEEPDVEKHDSRIREVWDYNLEEEFEHISALIDKYQYVAMDTEYPGMCIDSEDINQEEAGYKFIKDNVDILRLIQVGITLIDEKGNTPEPIDNLSPRKDRNHPDSLQLLVEAGINFSELERQGIEHLHFWDALLGSGLVLNEEITWITFHGACDFAYLVRGLYNEPLPAKYAEFFELSQIYFPSIYDLKFILNETQLYRNGSLSKLAVDLGVKRTGTMHQAGSDSHLTAISFYALRKEIAVEDTFETIKNKVWGFTPETGLYIQGVDRHYATPNVKDRNMYLQNQFYTQMYGSYQFFLYNVQLAQQSALNAKQYIAPESGSKVALPPGQ